MQISAEYAVVFGCINEHLSGLCTVRLAHEFVLFHDVNKPCRTRIADAQPALNH